MAVIVPGPIVADIRGKCGGVTYSRNQGGLYVKANPDWVQPASEFRDYAKECTEAVAKAWSADLTEPQRQAWREYAAQNPRPNRWGARTLHNGYAFFVRANWYIYWVGQVLQFPDPPDIPPTGPYTWSITRGTPPANYEFHVPIQTYPSGQTDVLLYLSDQLPKPAGQTGTRGPWRLLEFTQIAPGDLPIDRMLAPVWPLGDNEHRAMKAITQWLPSGAFATTTWSQLNT